MQITTESSVASMNKPKISIIVPVYNTELYLRECIESILRQSFMNFEVLLVDDGSTDASGSICEDYAAKDTRIRVFHQDNQGVSSARNLALDHVQGRYVLFLDADDFWYVDTCLETLVNEALRTDADIVRGEYKTVDEQGNDLFARKINRRKMKQAYRLVSSATFLKDIIQGEFFLVLSLIKADKVSQIRFRKGQVFLEDMDFYTRLMLQPLKCVFVPCRFYAYRKYMGSASNIQSLKKAKQSFEMCDCFESYACQTDNRRLKRYFEYRSVMMYYWTLASLDANKARLLAKELNLNHLQKLARNRMWKYGIFNTASLYILLPPVHAMHLLRSRNSIHACVYSIYRKIKSCYGVNV